MANYSLQFPNLSILTVAVSICTWKNRSNPQKSQEHSISSLSNTFYYVAYIFSKILKESLSYFIILEFIETI